MIRESTWSHISALAVFCFDMHYFLLISVFVLGLWMTSIICVKIWLSYRAYKFISKETDVNIILNSHDEVFYTQNFSSPLNRFLLKVFTLISRN